MLFPRHWLAPFRSKACAFFITIVFALVLAHGLLDQQLLSEPIQALTIGFTDVLDWAMNYKCHLAEIKNKGHERTTLRSDPGSAPAFLASAGDDDEGGIPDPGGRYEMDAVPEELCASDLTLKFEVARLAAAAQVLQEVGGPRVQRLTARLGEVSALLNEDFSKAPQARWRRLRNHPMQVLLLRLPEGDGSKPFLEADVVQLEKALDWLLQHDLWVGDAELTDTQRSMISHRRAKRGDFGDDAD